MAGKIISGSDVGVFRKTIITSLFSGPVTASFTAPHTITFSGVVGTDLRDAFLAGLSLLISGSVANNGLFHYNVSDVSIVSGGHLTVILTESVITQADSSITVSVYPSADGEILYSPVVCGRSCVLTLNTEVIEITTKSSSQFKEYAPQYSSWSLSFEGFSKVDEPGTLSVDDIVNLQIAKTKLFTRTKALKEGSASSYLYFDGEGYATQSTLTGQDNNVAAFAFSIQGSGDLTAGSV